MRLNRSAFCSGVQLAKSLPAWLSQSAWVFTLLQVPSEIFARDMVNMQPISNSSGTCILVRIIMAIIFRTLEFAKQERVRFITERDIGRTAGQLGLLHGNKPPGRGLIPPTRDYPGQGDRTAIGGGGGGCDV